MSNIDLKELQPALIKPFSRVLIEDSTKCELAKELQKEFHGFGGNASQSSLKINTVYDLIKAKFVHMSEHSGTMSDQTLGQMTKIVLSLMIYR